VRLAQQGDLVAFNAIVERYQRMAFNLALRMMGDRGLAEDVTQEAFFSAYRNVGRFRGGSLKSWLITIVANGARDQLRSPARRRATSLEAFTEGGDPAGPWPDRGPMARPIARCHNSRLINGPSSAWSTYSRWITKRPRRSPASRWAR